ncbi:hypothetical protein EVAR_77524_1 [Eumeta japonica]|uniref:Uncharacterized protein n=1 Tax=Eumeta variegata TaxID=151549 RepID=A0A4C1T6F9_EUMVA|nr:hypothetical protein EVAR_77524_1 [Eumeta japonica]
MVTAPASSAGLAGQLIHLVMRIRHQPSAKRRSLIYRTTKILNSIADDIVTFLCYKRGDRSANEKPVKTKRQTSRVTSRVWTTWSPGAANAKRNTGSYVSLLPSLRYERLPVRPSGAPRRRRTFEINSCKHMAPSSYRTLRRMARLCHGLASDKVLVKYFLWKTEKYYSTTEKKRSADKNVIAENTTVTCNLNQTNIKNANEQAVTSCSDVVWCCSVGDYCLLIHQIKLALLSTGRGCSAAALGRSILALSRLKGRKAALILVRLHKWRTFRRFTLYLLKLKYILCVVFRSANECAIHRTAGGHRRTLGSAEESPLSCRPFRKNMTAGEWATGTLAH